MPAPHLIAVGVVALAYAMLLLALAAICQRRAMAAMRLIAWQSGALAGAMLALGSSASWPAAVGLAALIVAAKVFLVPRLLRRMPDADASDDRPAVLPTLLLSMALAALAWLVVPLAGPPHFMQRALGTLALAMVLLGLLPTILGRPALARLLGLLAAENGVMLAAGLIPGTGRAILLQMTTLTLISALLWHARRDSIQARPPP